MGSSLLLVTCILSTLVATGFSLSCTECQGKDEKSCKKKLITCPEDSKCMAIYTFITDGAQEEKKYIRSCGDSRLCSQKGSFTYAEVEIKISTTCCYASNCNPPMPELPQTKSEKNGVSCMVCEGSGDTPCTSGTNGDCNGDENQCVSLFVTTEPFSNRSLRGCGTPELCKINEIGFDSRKLGMDFTCPSENGNGNGSRSLQYNLFLLIFAPMIFVKVMG